MGEELPMACAELSLHAKLFARHMEALLRCDPPRRREAAAVYADARSRGLLLGQKAVKLLSEKFAELAQSCRKHIPAERPVHRRMGTTSVTELIGALETKRTGGVCRDG